MRFHDPGRDDRVLCFVAGPCSGPRYVGIAAAHESGQTAYLAEYCRLQMGYLRTHLLISIQCHHADFGTNMRTTESPDTIRRIPNAEITGEQPRQQLVNKS